MVFYKIRVSGYSFVKKPEISFKDLILNFFFIVVATEDIKKGEEINYAYTVLFQVKM